MSEENRTYDEGVQDGYNYAVVKILEALGLQVQQQDQEEENQEFMRKPAKK